MWTMNHPPSLFGDSSYRPESLFGSYRPGSLFGSYRPESLFGAQGSSDDCKMRPITEPVPKVSKRKISQVVIDLLSPPTVAPPPVAAKPTSILERLRKNPKKVAPPVLETPAKPRKKSGSPKFPVLATKPRKKNIPKAVKDLCWDRWVGDSVASTECLCCYTRQIKMNNFHCGHVIAEANGGRATVDNLRPICATCNTSMRTKTMTDFQAEHGFVRKPDSTKNQ